MVLCKCVTDLGLSACGGDVSDCMSTLCETCYSRHRPSSGCNLVVVVRKVPDKMGQAGKGGNQDKPRKESVADAKELDTISISSTESFGRRVETKHVDVSKTSSRFERDADETTASGNSASCIVYNSNNPIRPVAKCSCAICGGSHPKSKVCGPKCGCSEVGLRSCAIYTRCPNALCPKCKSYHAVDATVRCRFIRLGALEARVARGSVTSIIQSHCGCIELGLPGCKDDHCQNHRCLDCGHRHSKSNVCGPSCGCAQVGRKEPCRVMSKCPNVFCNICLTRHLQGKCSQSQSGLPEDRRMEYPREQPILKKKRVGNVSRQSSNEKIKVGESQQNDGDGGSNSPLNPFRSKRTIMTRTRNPELRFGDIVLVEDEDEEGTGYIGKVYMCSNRYVLVRWFGVEDKDSVKVEHGFETTSWQPGYVAELSNKVSFFQDGLRPHGFVGYTDIVEDVNVVLNFDNFEFGGRISKQGMNRFRHLNKTHRSVKVIKNRPFEKTESTLKIAREYARDLFSSNVNTTVLRMRNK